MKMEVLKNTLFTMLALRIHWLIRVAIFLPLYIHSGHAQDLVHEFAQDLLTDLQQDFFSNLDRYWLSDAQVNRLTAYEFEIDSFHKGVLETSFNTILKSSRKNGVDWSLFTVEDVKTVCIDSSSHRMEYFLRFYRDSVLIEFNVVLGPSMEALKGLNMPSIVCYAINSSLSDNYINEGTTLPARLKLVLYESQWLTPRGYQFQPTTPEQRDFLSLAINLLNSIDSLHNLVLSQVRLKDSNNESTNFRYANKKAVEHIMVNNNGFNFLNKKWLTLESHFRKSFRERILFRPDWVAKINHEAEKVESFKGVFAIEGLARLSRMKYQSCVELNEMLKILRQ